MTHLQSSRPRQLLHRFNEATQVARLPSENPPSEELVALREGEIQYGEYLLLRMESFLTTLDGILDKQDIRYIRAAWAQHVQENILPSGLWTKFELALLQGTKMRDNEREAKW